MEFIKEAYLAQTEEKFSVWPYIILPVQLSAWVPKEIDPALGPSPKIKLFGKGGR